MNSLLAKGAWVLDILFFVLLFLGVFFGVKRGFLKSVCKLAGTIFSVIIAVTFCVSLQAALENSFGWTTAISRSVGSPFGQWIMVAICFIFLLVLVKLGCWLLGKGGTALIDSFAPIRILNMFLGGILGAFQMFIAMFVLFAIFRWIPSEPLHNFVESSSVVGVIFNPSHGSWFYDATHMNFHL